MPQDLFQTSKNILSQMPQDFLFKPFKISCHNCHRPSEIFSGKVKKSLSQMPQDFFQTIQNLLSHLPQAQLFFLWHLWQEMLRSLKIFCARKVIVTNATRFFFKPVKTSCHICHKPNCSSCGICGKRCWGVWKNFVPEKSLSQMPQDFFQRSQNRLSQLSQGQF